MAFAVVVSLIALAGAIAATAHSRRILTQEQNVFPPGVLVVGETAKVEGCAIRVNGADVAESVPSIDTKGSERRSAAPDWRFVRLDLSVKNESPKPVNLRKLFSKLRVIETATHEPADIEVVWLRGYDALPQGQLPPGQVREGKLAIYISGYSLVFPFIVQIGSAQFGLDVIDRDAPVQGSF